MKYLIIMLIALFFASCATQHNIEIKQDKNVGEAAIDTTTTDSTSYELVVLDPGFDSWYATNSKPEWYHSQDYYEYWNRRYVDAWNYDYRAGVHSRILNTYIDYDPDVDYGMALNHKLFYYFQYVVHELHIPLISDGPVTY